MSMIQFLQFASRYFHDGKLSNDIGILICRFVGFCPRTNLIGLVGGS